MEVIIKFHMPDDAEALDTVIHGADWFNALWEVRDTIQAQLDSPLPGEAQIATEALMVQFQEVMKKYKIELHDEEGEDDDDVGDEEDDEGESDEDREGDLEGDDDNGGDDDKEGADAGNT